MNETADSPALVFLHGPPASGKLTVGRALATLLGYPVFHNHLTVDLLTTVFRFGSPPFVRLREQFWMAVFREAIRAGQPSIFTFGPESTVPPGFPERVRRCVEGEGGRVRFVRLHVSEAEQERRILAEDRREFRKPSDVETLRATRDYGSSIEQPPIDLEVDTNVYGPSEAASVIVQQLGLPPHPPLTR